MNVHIPDPPDGFDGELRISITRAEDRQADGDLLVTVSLWARTRIEPVLEERPPALSDPVFRFEPQEIVTGYRSEAEVSYVDLGRWGAGSPTVTVACNDDDAQGRLDEWVWNRLWG